TGTRKRRGGRTGRDRNLVFLGRQVKRRKRDRGRGEFERGGRVVFLVPFCEDRGADIWLVLMVCHEEPDRSTQHAAAGILDRETRRLDATVTRGVLIHAGHIRQHADRDRLGLLRPR